VDLSIEVHVGHGIGLDVDPSYKPCWDHISLGYGGFGKPPDVQATKMKPSSKGGEG